MDAPIVSPAFDCGVCDVIHPHHCPKMVSWCQTCLPPISVAAKNALSHEIMAKPAAVARVAAVGIPADHCWTCNDLCRGHRLEKPKVPLIGRLSA